MVSLLRAVSGIIYMGGRVSADFKYKSGIWTWSEMALRRWPQWYATRRRLPGGERTSTRTDLAHPPLSATSATTRPQRI